MNPKGDGLEACIAVAKELGGDEWARMVERYRDEIAKKLDGRFDAYAAALRKAAVHPVTIGNLHRWALKTARDIMTTGGAISVAPKPHETPTERQRREWKEGVEQAKKRASAQFPLIPAATPGFRLTPPAPQRRRGQSAEAHAAELAEWEQKRERQQGTEAPIVFYTSVRRKPATANPSPTFASPTLAERHLSPKVVRQMVRDGIKRRRTMRFPEDMIRREILDAASKVRAELGFSAEECEWHENLVRLEFEAQGLAEPAPLAPGRGDATVVV